MLMQVQQLEKEKKELAERLRIIAKRIDHTERAYRKEEKPLLEADYEVQKQSDYAAYLAVQESKKAEALKYHTEGLKSKERLSRIVKDGTFDEWKKIFEKKRGEEFERKRNDALRKMEDEKAKRKAKVLKQKEEERKRLEELEREKREQEEEERRQEEGELNRICDLIKHVFLMTISRTSSRRGAPCCGGGCSHCGRGSEEKGGRRAHPSTTSTARKGAC